MAPKGGRGKSEALDMTMSLRQEFKDEAAVREKLQDMGYQPSRISQLMKATATFEEKDTKHRGFVSDSFQSGTQP